MTPCIWAIPFIASRFLFAQVKPICAPQSCTMMVTFSSKLIASMKPSIYFWWSLRRYIEPSSLSESPCPMLSTAMHRAKDSRWGMKLRYMKEDVMFPWKKTSGSPSPVST